MALIDKPASYLLLSSLHLGPAFLFDPGAGSGQAQAESSSIWPL